MEIPVLYGVRNAGTYVGSVSREREARYKRRRRAEGKAAAQQAGAVKRSEKEVAKHAEQVPRKAAIEHRIPVPETDTGG